MFMMARFISFRYKTYVINCSVAYTLFLDGISVLLKKREGQITVRKYTTASGQHGHALFLYCLG